MNLVYDFRVAPNSFDIATFIANAFLFARLNEKKIEKITLVQVAFRPEASWNNQKIPKDYESRKVDSVAYAISRLVIDDPTVTVVTGMDGLVTSGEIMGFPAGYDPAALPRDAFSSSSLLPCNEVHTNFLYEKARIPPRPFRPNEVDSLEVLAKWGRRYATLTVRNSILNTARNDSVVMIEKFRKPLKAELEKLGVKLVIIPDRENLDPLHPGNQFRDENVDIEASLSISRRYALYSNAVMNISPSTGPNILLVFSDFPYFIYGCLDESVAVMRRSFFARKGPVVGQQRPWATQKQWTDWQDRNQFCPTTAISKIISLVTL